MLYISDDGEKIFVGDRNGWFDIVEVAKAENSPVVSTMWTIEAMDNDKSLKYDDSTDFWANLAGEWVAGHEIISRPSPRTRELFPYARTESI